MRRTWTIIGVGDVAASFDWYQSLLGLPKTAPAKSSGSFDQVMAIYDEQGEVRAAYVDGGGHVIHYGPARMVGGSSVEFTSTGPATDASSADRERRDPSGSSTPLCAGMICGVRVGIDQAFGDGLACFGFRAAKRRTGRHRA